MQYSVHNGKFMAIYSSLILQSLISACTTPHTAVDCGSLNNLTNGIVSLDSTLRGSEAIYSCQDNYTLVGEALRVCTDDEEWSEEEPLCQGTSFIDLLP